MRSVQTSPARFPFLLLAALLLFAAPARAAEDTYETEYDEHARVMRVSLLRGEVSLRRDGQTEWESAKLNLPLVEGDTLATGKESRLEIQIDAYNFVRIGEDSVLRVVTLREEGVALSLSEGTASVRLARFDREHEYFELDAPKTTVAAEKKGLYRLDAARDGSVRVTVRDEGRARIYSETSGFVLRNDRTARLAFDADDEGDWEISAAPSFDDWDSWNDERERHLASRLRYEYRDRYYDTDVYGAEELDSYGEWSHHRTYGWVWRPHVTVINNYYNWAPYRYGHWRWCPPYGWTWVAEEPWGWAPYHYGRWVYVNNNWCWAPRGYGYDYGRAWWRPALVAFVHVSISSGHHVAWYPLGHGQRDPRGRHYRQRLAPLGAGRIANLERTNPALLRAVTAVPAREFGVETLRARPATNDIARRAVTGDPVRGRLPITPAEVGRVNPSAPTGRAAGTPDERPGLTIIRPARTSPPRAIPAGTTGAAERTPGVPLDRELRRARVFNGREPRVAPPSSAGSAGDVVGGGARDTGVVERPVRSSRPSQDVWRGGADEAGTPATRPARPPRANPDAGVVSPDTTTRPERARPVERDRDDDGGEDHRVERRAPPARPSEESRPAPRVYEPRERVRPEPGESPRAAPPRQQAPPRRHEAPQPRPSAPPPARSEPPPQSEGSPPSSSPPPQQQQPREERPAPPSPPARSQPRESPPRARDQ